jgi:hypothetical protein
MAGEDPTIGTAEETAAPPPEQAEVDLGALVGCVITDLRALGSSITGIAVLEWQRLRVRAIDAVLRTALLLLLFAAGTAAAIAAGVLVVAGARDALAEWVGAEWAGELLAGALVLIGLVLAGATLRSVVRRRIVAEAVRPRET